MQEIIASVDHIKFDLEIAVEQQLGAQPLPFPGMDKSGAAVCEFFLKAACGKGGMCPFRHISGEKTVVCKHWLRGLCKKGDQCEFLHEYDMTKMPECYFYSKFGPLCRHRHTRRVICVNYLVGFCPEGPSCKFMHPRFELPMGTTEQPPLPQQTQPPSKRAPQVIGVMQSQNSSAGNRGPRPLEQVTCYKCGEKGHYANRCTKGHLAFLSGQ
ncbi:cleavage and polyadenylation specificity factor subunit 4 isoform X8 [Ochotona curzoniae]|uniref:Cleavage and polyadenylation specificity factor subunit 4 n=2 Tax=Rodentia TaxID=9989 RepID=A0A8C2V4L6_CHILA|nr:cleavage and polyadenylation specificity factor subunit 4 isoform X8 [Ochotona curzoniae]